MWKFRHLCFFQKKGVRKIRRNVHCEKKKYGNVLLLFKKKLYMLNEITLDSDLLIHHHRPLCEFYYQSRLSAAVAGENRWVAQVNRGVEKALDVWRSYLPRIMPTKGIYRCKTRSNWSASALEAGFTSDTQLKRETKIKKLLFLVISRVFFFFCWVSQLLAFFNCAKMWK